MKPELSVILVLCLLLMGCGTTKLNVMVTKPAEVNLKDVKRIAIGNIEGRGSVELFDELEAALLKSGRFEVLDRNNIQAIIREHQLNLSDLVDQSTAVELGKFLGADALIFGRTTEHDYNEQTTSGTWQDKQGVSHIAYERKGVAKVAAVIQITELRTGKLMMKSPIESSTSETTRANDAQPAAIDSTKLLKLTRAEVLSKFMKMIAPYQVQQMVILKKSKKTSILEQGISYAKLGSVDKALEIFESAVKSNPEDPIAHFDLGAAYELNGAYEKAESCYQKAYSLKADKTFINALNRCRQRKLDEQRLKEQGAQ